MICGQCAQIYKYVEGALGITGDGYVGFSSRVCSALDELANNMCLGPWRPWIYSAG